MRSEGHARSTSVSMKGSRGGSGGRKPVKKWACVPVPNGLDAVIADVARGIGAGADDYMVKPFPTQELVAKVRELLEANPA